MRRLGRDVVSPGQDGRQWASEQQEGKRLKLAIAGLLFSLLSEGHDDVAQVGEAVVDGLCLLKPHPREAAALLDPLAAGQVHLGEGGGNRVKHYKLTKQIMYGTNPKLIDIKQPKGNPKSLLPPN